MTSFLRKVMTGLALLVVGGLVIGGTMALASDRRRPAPWCRARRTRRRRASPAACDDDGTPDQGPGDVPVNGDQVSDDDDGTPDQGPGDFPFGDDEVGDDDDGTPDQGPGDFPFERRGRRRCHGHDGGDDDNSGPSENSGPGSDDSGHGSDDSGHGSDDDCSITDHPPRGRRRQPPRRRRPRHVRRTSIWPRWPTTRTARREPTGPHPSGPWTRSSSLGSPAPRRSPGSLVARTSRSATSPSSASPSTAE